MFSSTRYEPAYDPASWVTVDELSGIVTTMQQIDRESPYGNHSFYTIILQAVDDGKCLPKIRGGGRVFPCFLRGNDTSESLSPQLGKINKINLFSTMHPTWQLLFMIIFEMAKQGPVPWGEGQDAFRRDDVGSEEAASRPDVHFIPP